MIKLLNNFGIEHELTISSAHRSPDRTQQYAVALEDRGLQIVIACAGAAAHLAGVRTDAERVGRLNRFLFLDERFSGNRGNYYDPRNSYLNEVIDRRCGIPITLSVVYMAIADRLGLDARRPFKLHEPQIGGFWIVRHPAQRTLAPAMVGPDQRSPDGGNDLEALFLA